MLGRKTIFANGEFYHVFNKTVGREISFDGKRNVKKAIEIMDYYRYSNSFSLSSFLNSSQDVQHEILRKRSVEDQLLEIHAFSLMPNHWHFLLKQLKTGGISQFISNFQNSFAKYFNIKNERQGSLFIHPFKAVRIESVEQFIHTSRYIHLNHVTSYLIEIEKLANEPRSSFGTYIGGFQYNYIETRDIMEYFKKPEKYKQFVFDQVDYQRRLKEIKDLLF